MNSFGVATSTLTPQTKTANNYMSTTLIPVNSSAIRAVGYDGSTLIVKFHSGRVYNHPRVPYSVFASLMQPTSKGTYYNDRIRGQYR